MMRGLRLVEEPDGSLTLYADARLDGFPARMVVARIDRDGNCARLSVPDREREQIGTTVYLDRGTFGSVAEVIREVRRIVADAERDSE